VTARTPRAADTIFAFIFIPPFGSFLAFADSKQNSRIKSILTGPERGAETQLAKLPSWGLELPQDTKYTAAKYLRRSAFVD
jgi:hypothetical protein